jgi:hypothetical protein
MKTDQPLHTPAEWAALFGITGLVAAEWQDRATTRVPRKEDPMLGTIYDRVEGPTPDWDRPMTEREFKHRLHGVWYPGRSNPDAPAWQRNFGKDRTKRMPRFAPTREQVLDALGEFTGWVETSAVTEVLAEPLGYTVGSLPPNTKVLALLRELHNERLVVEIGDPIDRDRIPKQRRGGNAKEWLLRSVYDGLVADRDDDQTEHDRRRTKLALVDPSGAATYSHNSKLMFVDGNYAPSLDTGTVTVPWALMESLIDTLTGNERR